MVTFFTPKFKLWQVCVAKSHAKFLNESFGTDYESWGKNYWWYTDKLMVWFPRIDGKVRNDFKNIYLDKDTVLQKYCGETGMFAGKPIEMDKSGVYRLIFEVVDVPKRKYIFQGVFIMDKDRSTTEEMIFKKVFNDYPMK